MPIANPSQTGICNDTLGLLATSATITSINDGTPLARQLLRHWPEAVRETLAAHPWNPCLQRVAVAASADFTPAGDQWSTAFEKPAGMLRWLPWAPGHDDHFDGEEEGDYILSNEDGPIVIRGIFLIEDLSRWTPHMRAALTAKLAAKCAKAITGQASMIDRMEAKFAEAMTEAKKLDGLATGERNRNASFRSSWLDARNSW